MGNTIIVSKIPAYLARPQNKPKAGVLVVHEVWGLTDHIKSVADRLADEGYLALAPDLLTGTTIDQDALKELEPDLFDPQKRNQAQPKLRQLMTPMNNPDYGELTVDKLESCFDYLYAKPETNQSVSVIGFCFGGTYSYKLATREERLKLALPFYGHADFSIDQLKQINCPIRAFYGEKDSGLVEQMENLPDMMAAADVDYEQKIYPNCGHAFFNDTNKFAYNKEAADDAWQIALTELANT